MIGKLARDGLRLLVRPRAAASVAIAGALFGAFVRATQQSSASELAGLDVRGSSLQSLMSGVFLFATCIGLVFGVLLGHDDHETGFIAQLAIRPVSRISYVVGRGLGLMLATALATLLLVMTAFLVANVGAEGFPTLKTIERAQRVVVAGHVLEPGDVVSIDSGQVARFEFPPRAELNCRFTVVAQPRLGEFTGKVHYVLRAMNGDQRASGIESDSRDTGPFEFQMSGTYPDTGVVEIENETAGAALSIASDQLVLIGHGSNVAVQLALALLLLVAAATIVAMLAFCFSTALSAGPAALAAGFFLLIALGRGAVLDVLADALSSKSALRDGCRGAVSLAPDLERFDLSERFGIGEALGLVDAARLFGMSAIYVAASLALAAALLSWRDRR